MTVQRLSSSRRAKTGGGDVRIAFYGGPLAGKTNHVSGPIRVGDLLPAEASMIRRRPKVEHETTAVVLRVRGAMATCRGQ